MSAEAGRPLCGTARPAGLTTSDACKAQDGSHQLCAIKYNTRDVRLTASVGEAGLRGRVLIQGARLLGSL